MKKKLLLLLAIMLTISALVYARHILTKDTKPVEIPVIHLAEERRTILFLPHYLATNLGYFAEQSIDVRLTTVKPGETAHQLLANRGADVILAGPGQAILAVPREGTGPVAFGEITQRDGAFFLAREPKPDFQWKDVQRRTIISGPATEDTSLVLEYILRQHDIAPHWHVNVIENLPPFLRPGVFKSGTGSFLVAEEPEVSMLEAEGLGTVVASLGQTAGKMPSAVYLAYPSYLDSHSKEMQGLINGLHKAQQWMNYHSADEMADLVEDYFPDIHRDLLVTMIERYIHGDLWSKKPVIDKENYQNLYAAVENSGELSNPVPYNKAVTNGFSNKAIKEVHYIPEDQQKPKPGFNWRYIKSLFTQ